MEKAIDSSTGKLIAANEAVGRHGFICPVCGKDVYWRRGNQNMRPSFCHRPGEGNEDCENFHPGQSFIGKSHPLAEQTNPTLFITPSELPKNTLDWNLEISIPPAPKTKGRVVVEQSIHGTRTIPLSKLNGRRYLVPVPPDTRSFKMRTEGIEDIQYDNCLNSSIPGLDEGFVNVFNFSEVGGSIILGSGALFVGRQYFFVLHKSLRTEIPPEVVRHRLKEKSNWHCVIVEYPSDPSESLKRWTTRYVNRSLQKKPPEFVLIYPFEREIVDKNFLVVRKGEPIIVGLVGSVNTLKPERIAFLAPGTNYAKSADLNGDFPFTFLIHSKQTGVFQFYIPDIEQVSLMVGIREELKLETPQPVYLVVTTENSTEEQKVPLHSIETKSILRSVVRGQATFVSLKVPNSVQAEVRFRAPGNPLWKSVSPSIDERGENDNGLTAYERWLSEQIVMFLRDPNIDWEIDFQNFGQLRWCRSENLVALTGTSVISRKILSRITWLLSCSNMNSTRKSNSPALNQIRELFESGDIPNLSEKESDLLRRLSYKSSLPPKFEPYLHQLALDLSSLAKRLKMRSAYGF